MFENILHGLHRFKKRFAGNIDLVQIPIVSTFRKQVILLSRKKVVENVNGFTMHVDDNDSLALSWHHVFEPGTTEYFKKNILPGQTVIDLGANIGYFTLLFSGLVGPNGHVYAFEPEPETANLLRRNLEINLVKNVTVIEMAVDSVETNRRLYINKVNRGNHQIFDSGEIRKTIEIKTTTLDTYFADQPLQIDWIKMDIEGAEVGALRGMKNVLLQNPKLVLVTEIFVPGLIAAGSSAEKYIHALKDFRFEFEKIDERNNKITPLSEEDLIRSLSQTKSVYPNIICRRTNLE